MKLAELAQRLGGSLHADPNLDFHGFSLDSRSVAPSSVFLAISGANHDGHAFVAEAMRQGAEACVVERPIAEPHILVENLVQALANLGRSLRREFSGPVVGVTGSNGKTSAKEMIAACLSSAGPVLKTEGNQNTEYTSPLIWTRALPEHWSAVIEMGMRGTGQIRHLAGISEPTHALITMIGTAHIEMVGSRQGIAEAKSEILEGLGPGGAAHLWAEDEFLSFLTDRSPAPVRTYGFGHDAESRVVGYRALNLTQSLALIQLGGHALEIKLPTIGRHQALNAAAALLIAHSLGVDLHSAAAALEDVKLPPMRFEVRDFQGAKLILDNYNASPDSMVAALKTFDELPTAGRRIALIGEMKELGAFSEIGHRRVGLALSQATVDEVILFGDQSRFMLEEALQHGMSKQAIRQAESLAQAREWLCDAGSGDLILVKGSRALALETIFEGALA